MADLESRKRAPLYQKRQEEELAAAVARAAEAEERAAAADARAKDAKVPGGLQTRMQALCPDLEVTPQLHQIPMGTLATTNRVRRYSVRPPRHIPSNPWLCCGVRSLVMP